MNSPEDHVQDVSKSSIFIGFIGVTAFGLFGIERAIWLWHRIRGWFSMHYKGSQNSSGNQNGRLWVGGSW